MRKETALTPGDDDAPSSAKWQLVFDFYDRPKICSRAVRPSGDRQRNRPARNHRAAHSANAFTVRRNFHIPFQSVHLPLKSGSQPPPFLPPRRDTEDERGSMPDRFFQAATIQPVPLRPTRFNRTDSVRLVRRGNRARISFTATNLFEMGKRTFPKPAHGCSEDTFASRTR